MLFAMVSTLALAKKRQRHSAQFKLQLALEALKEQMGPAKQPAHFIASQPAGQFG
jgi:hypothetical protein